MLICGASFAGLAVARELAGSGADVLIVDRYEIGERQTSACGIPTQWLERLGLMEAERQRFDSLVIHTPARRRALPAALDLLHLRLPDDLRAALGRLRRPLRDRQGRGAGRRGVRRAGTAPTRSRSRPTAGRSAAPLVVDALGWRRVLAGPAGYQPPDAPLSRGLEVHPEGGAEDLEIWIDRRYVPAGYGWSFPAGEETRIGVGSFDPKFHVRETTELLADDLERDNVRYQGNWIPHKLRAATGRGVFFAGDSAGHCLPLTAEGIRTALYFGMALGRELRGVVEGRQSREDAATHYAAFNDSHEWKFKWMLRVQKLVPRIPPRLLGPLIRIFGVKRFVDWSFRHYLAIAPPEFADAAPEPAKPEVPTAV